MEYIIDNGQDYSAHEIFFLHGSMNPEFLKKLLNAFRPGYEILGIAEKINWWGARTAEVESIFHSINIYFSRDSFWPKNKEDNYTLLVQSPYAREKIKYYLKPEIFEFKEFILSLFPLLEEVYVKGNHYSKEHFLFLKERLKNEK